MSERSELTCAIDEVGHKIRDAFGCDSLQNDVNMVDAVQELATAARQIGNAITPSNALGTEDEAGRYVSSLTEAVMGITAGLIRLAEAIDRHADK